MGKTYLCWKGLQQVAKEAKGDERISIGIRPYGFHAGNELTLFVYPWHLCNLVQKLGKEPKFTFFISLNDTEPEGLKYLYEDSTTGYYYKKEDLILTEEVPFEYNIFPKNTSFQYTTDPEGCCKSMAEHWSKLIKQKVLRLKKDFPLINITFIDSSSTTNTPAYKKALKLIISRPEILGNIVNEYSKVCFEKDWLSWAGAICPNCHSAQGKTTISKETVTFECEYCGQSYSGDIEKTSFWMHHMLLLAPRLKLFNIDLFFRGYDHYSCNHIPINEKLYKELYSEHPKVKTIVPPLIIRPDGRKMSKSRSNEKTINTQKLKSLVENCKGEKIVLK
ncbi:MAG: hypothetical protein WCW13_05410 [archaeon]|jgi:hypothetical protein